MSLQDKKMQLLQQDDNNNDAEVEDIFSRYESDHPQESAPANDSDNNENSDDPIERVVTNLNENVELENPDPKNPSESMLEDEKDMTDDLMDEIDVPDDTSEPAEKQWEKELDEKENNENLEIPENPEVPKVDEKEIDKSEEEDVPASEPEPVEEKSDDDNDVPVPVEKEPVRAVPPQRANVNAVMHSQPPQQKVSKTQAQSDNEPPVRTKIDPGKKTIMIVDDDVDTLDMYADIFENANYNVLRAIDGLDALNVISDHTPHVIFTGIVMPRMDGFALMDALKQNKRTADIPVVINSHLGRAHDKKRAEELGAKDFIVRGFTPPREALERIGALLMRNEYVFRFDHNDPEARKLAKDLGAGNFFVCPRGQEMVIKLSIIDPKELQFSARFSCVDEKKS